jgi:hypothetical protein
MRIGQKNSLVYQWAKKGTRPRQPKDQRYENAYLFGAVCPSRDTGVAIIMPNADTEAMQAHVEEIGRAVATGAHALLILDKAGWHTPRASSNSRTISRWCRCRLPARSSTLPKISGNTCARPISPIACSRATPPSLMPVKMPGVSFSQRSVASHPSPLAIGRLSINDYEGWYKAVAGRLEASVAWPLATVVAKRTQRLHGVWD